MNNNAKLNLNGVFGFNKLLVGKVNVEPNIQDNTADIKYIYNNALTTLQNEISATVQNALNASQALTGFNSQMTGFQTNLSNQIAKEANDVSNLQSQINSNYTTAVNQNAIFLWYSWCISGIRLKKLRLSNPIVVFTFK